MSVMTTNDGYPPYPKISGAKLGKRVVLTSQIGDSMNKCTTCGMSEKANPAHAADYTGVGKHSFKSATKSISELMQEDSPICFGDSIKALGDGRIGGWAVMFTDSEQPDLTNDYFDANTDFFFDGDTKAIRPLLYDHGLNATIKSRRLGKAELEIKDAGIWFESQLDISNAYDKAIYKLAEKGKLGASTGSAPHLIQRESAGKAFYVKSWPIVELSVTPKPIESKTKGAVVTLKSLRDGDIEREDFSDELKAQIDDAGNEDVMHVFEPSEDDSSTCAVCGESMSQGDHVQVKTSKKPATRNFKSLFEEELAKETASVYKLDSARDKVLRDIITAKQTSSITGVDIDMRQKVTECVTEYAARFIVLAIEQMQKFLDGEYETLNYPVSQGQPQFYLRSFENNALQSFLSMKSELVSGSRLDEHSTSVVSALNEFASESASLLDGVKSWIERCEEKIQFRAGDNTKAGRKISAATLSKLQEALEKLRSGSALSNEISDKLGGLIEIAQPAKSLDLTADFLLAVAKHNNDMAGVPSVH